MRNIKIRTLREQTAKKFENLRHVAPLTIGVTSWLRYTHKALGMTATQLAGRCGISQKTISQTLRKEEKGEITLRNLRRIADAMHCDLVYFVIPRKPLDELIAERARRLAERVIQESSLHMEIEHQTFKDHEEAIQDLADDLMYSKSLWEKA